LDQDHAQPDGAATETVVAPPAAAKASAEDEILGEHGCVPAWVTIGVFAPTDSAPRRDAEELFGLTVNGAVPFPLPLALAEGTVNQLASLVTVQLQPDGASTFVVPDPPAGPNDDGERDTV